MNTFYKAIFAGFLVFALQAPVLHVPLVVFAEESSSQTQESSSADSSTEEQTSETTTDDGKEDGKGEKGEKGEDGQDGDSGQDGQDGEDGQDGASDTQESAEDGENGTEGDNGEQGNTGEAGEDGENGETQENGTSGQGEDGGDATDGGDGTSGEEGGDGEQGENGEDANEKEDKPAEGDTTIETGEASSSGQVQNTGNTNVVNGNDPNQQNDEEEEEDLPLCSDKTRKDEGKGSKEDGKGSKEENQENNEQNEEEEEEKRCIEPDSGSGGDTEVENSNTADVENNAEIAADTGENEASGNEGSAAIDTGDAEAVLDLFNVINTNTIDSNGLFVLLSNLQEQILDMDVRDWMPYLKEYNEDCNSCYSLKELEALNKNLANITNNVNVTANTGGNEASGNEGEGNIETGDAYAAANVVNIANTNIVNSNYLLFVANNFGNFFGDIVFPNASTFLSSLFASPSQVYSEVDVENTNNAVIENNVSAQAETGGNQANGGASVIQTGDSSAAANVFNQANMNLVGGNSFVALIRVSGDWSGDVFGLPEGISWEQTAKGIMLYSDDVQFGSQNSAQEDANECAECGKEGGKGEKGSKAEQSELSVENQNEAAITNNMDVFALTGDNKANGNGKGNKVKTGNAQALANVVNVANTNVIGSNWLFAMFNILGDFDGNISFGRPDLWIGQRAEIPNDPALPGDQVTYYFTVANNGDIPAHDVQLTSVFDHPLFSFQDASQEHTSPAENEFTWDLGTIGPGEGMEISLTGTIASDLPSGTFAFTNTSTVEAAESDDDTADNTDSVELVVNNEPTSGGGSGSGGGNNNNNNDDNDSSSGGDSEESDNSDSAVSNEDKDAESNTGQPPNLQVVKTHAAEEKVRPGDSVEYTIVITNTNGGSAFNAVLKDRLETEGGQLVHEEGWELGEVFPDEEITVTYTVVFEEGAEAGQYINRAMVEASNGSSNIASTTLSVQPGVQAIQQEFESLQARADALAEQVFALGAPNVPPEQVASSGAQNNAQGETQEEKGKEPERQEAQTPFLASMADLWQQGYGSWLAALAAASLLALFLLFWKRRKTEET